MLSASILIVILKYHFIWTNYYLYMSPSEIVHYGQCGYEGEAWASTVVMEEFCAVTVVAVRMRFMR